MKTLKPRMKKLPDAAPGQEVHPIGRAMRRISYCLTNEMQDLFPGGRRNRSGPRETFALWDNARESIVHAQVRLGEYYRLPSVGNPLALSEASSASQYAERVATAIASLRSEIGPDGPPRVVTLLEESERDVTALAAAFRREEANGFWRSPHLFQKVDAERSRRTTLETRSGMSAG
jgi:hypothetical protein